MERTGIPKLTPNNSRNWRLARYVGSNIHCSIILPQKNPGMVYLPTWMLDFDGKCIFVIIPYIDAMNFCSLKSRFQVAKKNSMPSAFSWITWSGKNYPAELLKLSPLSNNTPSRVIFRSVIAELYYYFHNPELVLTFLFVTNISRPIPQFWSWWLSPFRVWTGICIRSQVRVCML